jgi:hypothetical protein
MPTVGLAALTAVGVVNSVLVSRKRGLSFDNSAAPWLIGLVLLGPLPAVLLSVPGTIQAGISGRWRPVAYLANGASVAWALFAAYGVLVVAGVPIGDGHLSVAHLGAFLLACLVYNAVNYFTVALLFYVIRDGLSFAKLVRTDFMPTLPAFFALFGLTAATLFLYTLIGIPALALFALIVYLPQLMLPRLLAPRSLAGMRRDRAVAATGIAIARKLGVADRVEREVRWRALSLDGKRQRRAARQLRAIEAERQDDIRTVQYELQRQLDGWDEHIADAENEESWAMRFSLRNIYEADKQRARAEYAPKIVELQDEAKVAGDVLRVASDWVDLVQKEGLSNEHAILRMRRPQSAPAYDPKALLAAAEIVAEQQIAEGQLQPEPESEERLTKLRRQVRALASYRPCAYPLLWDAPAEDCARAFVELVVDEGRIPTEARRVAEIAGGCLTERRVFGVEWSPRKLAEADNAKIESRLRRIRDYYRRMAKADAGRDEGSTHGARSRLACQGLRAKARTRRDSRSLLRRSRATAASAQVPTRRRPKGPLLRRGIGGAQPDGRALRRRWRVRPMRRTESAVRAHPPYRLGPGRGIRTAP